MTYIRIELLNLLSFHPNMSFKITDSIIQHLAIHCCPNKQYSKDEPLFEKRLKRPFMLIVVIF